MARSIYRYRFGERVPVAEVEATLVLALLAAEGIFGESRVRLETAHCLDRRRGVCVLEARGTAGRAANRVFVAFISREFGPDAFRLERVNPRQSDSTRRPRESAAAPSRDAVA